MRRPGTLGGEAAQKLCRDAACQEARDGEAWQLRCAHSCTQTTAQWRSFKMTCMQGVCTIRLRAHTLCMVEPAALLCSHKFDCMYSHTAITLWNLLHLLHAHCGHMQALCSGTYCIWCTHIVVTCKHYAVEPVAFAACTL